MATIRELAACIGVVKPEISVVHDFFGYATGAPVKASTGVPVELSLLEQARLLAGSFFNINLIKVGESFTSTEDKAIDFNLSEIRRIYAVSSVRLGVGRIGWFFISDEQVAAHLEAFSSATWDDNAAEITDEFNGPPGALDLFVVRNWGPGTGPSGRSAINGSCDHSYDLLEMTGSVAALGSSTTDHPRSARTFPHEVAHYLGLYHLSEIINPVDDPGPGGDITASGDDDEIGSCHNLMADPDEFPCTYEDYVTDPLTAVDLSPAQGRTMRGHCLVVHGCKP